MKALTPREVAEIWFGTPHPSAYQMRKVYAKMESGVLPLNDPGAPPTHWTTNEQALARYLAARRTTKEAAQHVKGKRIGPTAGPSAPPTPFVHCGDKELRDAYSAAWRSYFLAVIGRRHGNSSTRAFERAVVAGQVMIVLVTAILVAQAFGVSASARPIEHEGIAAHLAGIHGWHQIETWHPAETDSQGRRIVRVEYLYRDGDSHRVVHTDRTFLVTGTSVQEFHPGDGS
jgi:hypothetical protein